MFGVIRSCYVDVAKKQCDTKAQNIINGFYKAVGKNLVLTAPEVLECRKLAEN